MRLLGLSLLALVAAGQVRLPHILSDGMVIQRDTPVHVWGWARPAEKVRVEFRGATRAVAADSLGRWSAYLPPGEAGGPFTLTINRVVLRDVLVGDVWIAAGQSNMEWPIDWAADPGKEAAAANYPRIRLARTMHRVSDYPRSDWVGEQWRPCTPESVRTFSAVAYHFARNLHEQTKIPIGVVQSAWGGTPVEAWTSLRALSAHASLTPVFAEWAELTAEHEANLLRQKFTGEPRELRRRPGGQWMPGGLYNAMIAPLTPMAIKGVIWYQGEANTSPERAPYYGRVFEAMIRDWRMAWGLGDVPFLWVQLANYRGAADGMWPEVREAQRQALALENTAMAVTIDIGSPDDIHPGNKREVGRRLALALRGMSGPVLRQVSREGRSLRLWFEHAEDLRLTSDTSFEVAGEDGKFKPARARIDGATVVIDADGVAVRYAWRDNPAATLYNGAGLPASPFLRHSR